MILMPAFEMGLWNAWIFMVWLIIQNPLIRQVSKQLYLRLGDPVDMKPSHTYKRNSSISMILWLLAAAYSVFLPLQIETRLFQIGLVIFILSIALNSAALFQFAVTPASKPVTSGVYRFSRHPGYVSVLLTYLSIAIAASSWIFLLITIIFAILLQSSAVEEERYCLDQYGSEYRDYLAKTPRWVGLPKRRT